MSLLAASRVAAEPTLRRGLLQWADRTAGKYQVAIPRIRFGRLFRPQRLLRLTANLSVLVLVLILPFAAEAPAASSGAPVPLAIEAYGLEAARADLTGKALITNGRSPVTATAEGTRPIQTYTIGKDDTLSSLSNFYKISAEAIAFANGISDPTSIQLGRQIMIPPGEGALYTVKEGDTVESVAAHFKAPQAVIMSYNRLYFEPEHFAPGQLIYVEGAELPALVYQKVTPEAPTFISRPAVPAQVSPNGRLSWPVGGIITQRYWAGHRGVDVAAPYGTGIASPQAGTIVSTGWVAVGGLSVRVRHDNGLVTGYYHMSAVYVGNGQRVSAGQIVGAIGLTGVTTGPHVHWECEIGNVLVDCLSQ